jgi:hypothetical protein
MDFCAFFAEDFFIAVSEEDLDFMLGCTYVFSSDMMNRFVALLIQKPTASLHFPVLTAFLYFGFPILSRVES